MPVRFKAKGPDERSWRTLNETQIAVLGTGAFLDAVGDEVHIMTRRGAGMYSDGSLQIEITPDLFAELAQAMMDASPETASKAFGQALAMGGRGPIYDDDGRELG